MTASEALDVCLRDCAESLQLTSQSVSVHNNVSPCAVCTSLASSFVPSSCVVGNGSVTTADETGCTTTVEPSQAVARSVGKS